MTTNGFIATANVVIAVGLIALGAALLWQARKGLIAWPVSALVALAGPYLLAGVVMAQLAVFRAGDLPPALARDGLGTAVLRLALVYATLALVRRIVTGRLLTERDRRRVDRP